MLQRIGEGWKMFMMTRGRRSEEERRPQKKNGRDKRFNEDWLLTFLKIKNNRKLLEKTPIIISGMKRQNKMHISRTVNIFKGGVLAPKS